MIILKSKINSVSHKDFYYLPVTKYGYMGKYGISITEFIYEMYRGKTVSCHFGI